METKEYDQNLKLVPAASPLIKGRVKVHNGVIIQGFLSQIYKKGKNLFEYLDDIDSALSMCANERRVQEIKSRILAFRISSNEENLARIFIILGYIRRI